MLVPLVMEAAGGAGGVVTVNVHGNGQGMLMLGVGFMIISQLEKRLAFMERTRIRSC
jgi:hypothetical protein